MATTQCIDQRFFRTIEFLNQASIAWMPTIQTMNFTDVTYCCIHLSSRRISITLGLRGRDATPLMRPADQVTSHAGKTFCSTLRTRSEHPSRCRRRQTVCPPLLSRRILGIWCRSCLRERINATRLPLERRADSRNRLQSHTAKNESRMTPSPLKDAAAHIRGYSGRKRHDHHVNCGARARVANLV